nr:hypothetical protein [Tanacetum cinerariifolium]
MRISGKGFSGRVTPLFSTMVIQNQSELGEGSAMPTDPHHTPTIIQPLSFQPQKIQKPRKPKRKDTQVPQPSGPTESVVDEVVHKELGDSLVRVVTTASSLEAEQDSGNINKTQSKAPPNESSSQVTNFGGGPRGNTLQSDEDRMKLNELMALCTTLQNRVLDLEKTKTTQQNEIDSLKRRVKKLEKRNRSRTHKLKRLYKVGLSARVESSRNEESLGEDESKQKRRIYAINVDDEITLVNDANNEMFDVDDLGGEEVFVEGKNVKVVEEIVDAAQVSTAATTVTTEEITLAQVLEALKTSKPKAKGIVFQEPSKSTTTTTTTISSQQSHNKGKGIMIEEHVKPKKKDQIRLDEEAAKRLQAQKQEELCDVEKATLFQQLLEKRKKHFATKRAEEKRNKPPTQAQNRKMMYEEEVAIDIIPLAAKSPRIVDWKIHKEGKKGYYQIARANGKSQMYMFFSQMLKSFDRKDLEDFYKLVKARYGSTRPVENIDYLLWSDIKLMFEPLVEDELWKRK